VTTETVEKAAPTPFDEGMDVLVDESVYDFTSKSEVTEAVNSTNASIAQIIGPGAAPEIDPPEDGSVRLPGGLITKDGLVRSAVVRELTGEDEEALSKARGNPLRVTQTLLKAVETIGGEPVSNKVLKDLLVGDREALFLGIRIATFGKEIKFEEVECPGCKERLDITVDLTELPTRELADPEKREFEVALRNGVAVVRLLNGGDQDAVLEEVEATGAEENTTLLSRSVISINGTKVNNSKAAVKKLGIKDRQTLLTFLVETAPGPRYDEVKSKHEVCDTEIPLYLAVDDLFRDLL